MLLDLSADRIARIATVILSVLEIAPVVFASMGLFFLSRLIDRLDPRSGRMAKAAWALVTFGALSHAAWRVARAVLGIDLDPFATAPLVFCAPGLALLSAGLARAWAAVHSRVIRQDPWLAPIALGWLALLGAFYLHGSMGGEMWRLPLLALIVSAAATISFFSAALGWRLRLHMAAVLFAANLAAAAALAAVAAFPGSPLLLRFIVETLHAVSEAAFAIAAWRTAVEY